MDETHDEPRHPTEDLSHDQDLPGANPTNGHPLPSGTSGSGEQSGWRRFLSRRRVVAAGITVTVLLVGGTWLALVARHDGDSPTTTDKTAGANEAKAAAFEFAKCMRDHGIADWPDPTVGANGGISLGGVSDLEASNGQVQAARKACQHLLDKSVPSLAPRTAGPAAAGWKRIVPGGDCQCADGSEYSFYTRAANPKKVVLYLDGGGVCWSAQTCAPNSGNKYQTTVDAPSGEGVFDFTNRRNPFADYSFVYVPYCTADVHLGNATTRYAPGLTIQHKGYVNGTAALDYLTRAFPNATDVVVIGASAGSVTSPLYAGLVSDRLPDAHIAAFADSSGSYPDVPALNNLLTGSAWQADKAIPNWPGKTAGQRSMPGLFVMSGRHDPNIVFARHDYAYDEDQKFHLALAGVPGDVLALIQANETQIEAAGVNLYSYTAPGSEHVAFQKERFYTETVNGIALVDWVTKLLEGQPVDDVHCTDCKNG
jgi:hypothetical protein